MKTQLNRFFLFTAIAAALSSCHMAAQEQTGQEPQTYPVVQISARDTVMSSDYPATLEGRQNIEIRPKVDGYIEKIFIDEGAAVKKGQILFRISAPQYEQDVRNATAAINSAEADISTAMLQVAKAKPLVEQKIIGKYELEAAENTLKSKKAVLAQNKATLATAKTYLAYTTIYSPSDGVAGALPYKTGSLVSATSAQPLTTISDISKIYAYFSFNEKQLLEFLRASKGKTFAQKLEQLPAVSLVLSDGSVYAEKGKIETLNGSIDPKTGSAKFRATFLNLGGLIRSGGSAVLRVPLAIPSAVLVPQESTADIQGKRFVCMVDPSGRVKNIEIQTMEAGIGKYYVASSGLKDGDMIIMENTGSLRDSVKIKPNLIKRSKT